MDAPVKHLRDNETVKKHVAAIHVGGKLSLLQRKLSNCLLLNAYDDLLTKRSHRIDAQTLSAMAGYDSNDQATLRQALRALAETTAEWDMLGDDGEREWGVSSLISFATLKAGVCEYAYAPPLAEKLSDPAVFAVINMKIQRNFTSGHALALYENCYRFVRVGSTGWWEIDTFRRLMGLHDVAYYDVYSRLNAKVIKPAVAEVNKVSNIRLIAETRRESRSVSHIRFLVNKNDQQALFDLGDDAGVVRGPVFRRLVENGISERLARQWLSEHSEDELAAKLDWIEGERKRGRVRKTPAAYLTAAIKERYEVKPVPAIARKAVPVKAPVRDADEDRRHLRAEIEGAWRQQCLGAILAFTERHSPSRRKVDKDRFELQLTDEIDREQFRRFGWNSSLLFTQIRAYWEDLATDQLPKIEAVAAERGVADWSELVELTAG